MTAIEDMAFKCGCQFVALPRRTCCLSALVPVAFTRIYLKANESDTTGDDLNQSLIFGPQLIDVDGR